MLEGGEAINITATISEYSDTYSILSPKDKIKLSHTFEYRFSNINMERYSINLELTYEDLFGNLYNQKIQLDFKPESLIGDVKRSYLESFEIISLKQKTSA